MAPRAKPPEGPSTPDTPEATPASKKPHHHGHRDRLRARFLEAGEDSLQDYEILELMLFAAIPRRDVKPLAKDLLREFGGLGEVLSASPQALADRGKLGPVAIGLLRAANLAARRMLRDAPRKLPILGSWQQVLDYLDLQMKFSPTEEVRLLFLDRKNQLIKDERVGQGTIDHAPLYPREVVKRALALDSGAVIVVHNHPTGDPSPSRQDIDMTKALDRALKTVDISLHDHIIIGRHGRTSFRGAGLL